LRPEHIQKLRDVGIAPDFKYEFTLTEMGVLKKEASICEKDPAADNGVSNVSKIPKSWVWPSCPGNFL
jgi:hypothetical protein